MRWKHTLSWSGAVKVRFVMSVGSVCCECWGRCAASPEEVVCDTTVMGRSTMRAFVSSRAVLAAESVSKITTASCAPSLLASLQMPLINATIVGCLSTYLRSVSLVILPQNEKKSDTVFSVALGDMFDTNTAFDSYYMCEHMQHSYITYSYLCHGAAGETENWGAGLSRGFTIWGYFTKISNSNFTRKFRILFEN